MGDGITAITIPRDARVPLKVGKFARNDLPPTAEFQRQLAELAGASAFVRSKVIYRSAGSMVIPDSEAGGVDRTRGWFAWHSGPYATLLSVRFVMAQQNNGTPTSPYARIRVTTTNGDAAGDAYGRFGSASGATDVPARFGVRTTTLVDATTNEIVYLDPDTDYFATITEIDYARIHSIIVREISLSPDTDNGYAPIVSQGGPIYDSDRSAVSMMARNLHRAGGAHLWNWHAESAADAPVFSTSTYTNVIDETSTVTAFAPGATLDLRSCSRLKDGSNVPVVMKVYANGTNGVVRLVHQDDGTMMSVAVTAGAGWYPVQGMLPNTIARYVLHAAALTGTMTVYGVSIWQGDAASAQLASSTAYMRAFAFNGTASMS